MTILTRFRRDTADEADIHRLLFCSWPGGLVLFRAVFGDDNVDRGSTVLYFLISAFPSKLLVVVIRHSVLS